MEHLYRIPQPTDPVYAGKLVFTRMHASAVLYREIAEDGSYRMARFASAVEAQNYADEHNLEYIGMSEDRP